MARIFIDGFEGGDLSLWENMSGNIYVSTAQKKTGSYSLYINQRGNWIKKTLPSTISTIYFQFYMYSANWSQVVNAGIFALFNASGVQASLVHDTSGRMLAYRGGPGGTLLATGTATLTKSAWNLIEGKIVIDNVAGVFQVKVNGATPLDIDFSGNTRNQADNNITVVMLGTDTGTSNGYVGYIDNFVLEDAALPGGTEIMALAPNAVGNSAQWTPSAGDNYACVDEIPPAEADYVAVNSNDQLDLYNLVTPGAPATIHSVQIQAKAYRQGAATPTKLKLAMRTHDTDYVSGDKTPSATFATSLCNMWAVNPNTSAAWTVEEVEALQAGVKSAA